MLITDTQTHTQTYTQTHIQTHIRTDQSYKCDFRIQGPSKHVNPSKSPLRKFDPKTIVSLLIGKRK